MQDYLWKGGTMDLIEAAKQGDMTALSGAFKKGTDINLQDNDMVTALMHASALGHIDIVKFLIEKGADINAKNSWAGWNALIYSSMNGKTETVKYLIEKGADVNTKDNEGKTALMYASARGHMETVSILKTVQTKQQ
jgi:uncharacterized protein